MPVLPDVGSRIVCPAPISPLPSASSISARGAVLDRPGGIARLELGPDVNAGLGRQARQLDERRVPDRLHDVRVAAAARSVPQPLRRHYFTEYSEARETASKLGLAI